MILIRNDESRSRLPRELLASKAIIMTVQQSKGLEFDDVFLVDFFAGEPLWLEVSFSGITGGHADLLAAALLYHVSGRCRLGCGRLACTCVLDPAGSLSGLSSCYSSRYRVLSLYYPSPASRRLSLQD